MADIDPKVWEAKDRRIVRQSMLKAAVETVLGLGASDLDKFTLENVKRRVLETAETYVNWVYEVENKNAVSDISHPMPTPQQAEALKKVEEATGKTVSQVWAAFGRFPVMENVDSCIAKLKGI